MSLASLACLCINLGVSQYTGIDDNRDIKMFDIVLILHIIIFFHYIFLAQLWMHRQIFSRFFHTDEIKT